MFNSELHKAIITSFPYPIASVYNSLWHKKKVETRYYKLLDISNALINFCSTIMLSDYLLLDSGDEIVNSYLYSCIEEPYYKNLYNFFRESLKFFYDKNLKLFVSEMHSLERRLQDYLFLLDKFTLTPSDPNNKTLNEQCKDALESLIPKVERLFQSALFLENYELIRVIKKNENNSIIVEVWKGNKKPSDTITIEANNRQLENGRLYLLRKRDGELLPLYPFIIYTRSDKDSAEHFFFYNGMQDLRVKYFNFESFHSETFVNRDVIKAFGDCYLRKHLYQQAIMKYRCALELDPDSDTIQTSLFSAYNLLGCDYYQMENYESAAIQFEKAMSIRSNVPQIYYNLAYSYNQVKKFDASIEVLRKLLNISPKQIKAYEMLGQIYLDTNKYDEALKVYDQALELDPSYKKLVTQRQKALEKKEKGDGTTKSGKEDEINFDEILTDLTKLAREQLSAKQPVEHIIGREKEIKEIIEILCCKNKNSVALVGEPGVGKSALVQEIVIRIAEGKVPPQIKDKQIVELNLPALIAGTKLRGQFEEKMLAVVQELIRRKNCILYVDELHNIVYAGSIKGGVDASGILKPALSNGEIQCIGSTTLELYRNYVEKDPSLERRFQVVKLEESTIDETLEILKSKKSNIEKYHNVKISDEALIASAELPKLYLRDRYLPDKAIDLIDRAGALVSLQNTDDSNHLRIVTKEHILSLVSHMSGVPVSKLGKPQADRFLYLEEILKKRIVGQDEAIEAIARIIRTTKLRFDLKPNRPDGIFLFVGPTGVGKTETAKALAEFLFGDEEKMIRIDMAEYSEEISISRLIGSAPGYVGYQDPNQLTDKLRAYPYTLVLLDEIEKADPQVFTLFLQVFDAGRLTDSKGRTAYFGDATVIMTSNLGSELFTKPKIGYGSDIDKGYDRSSKVTKSDIMKAVKQFFSPEFLNRIDEIVFFKPLSIDEVKKIAELNLKGLHERLKKENKTLIVKDSALELIVSKGYSPEYGARYLQREIRKLLLDPLAKESLKPDWDTIKTIEVSAKDDELILTKKDEFITQKEELSIDCIAVEDKSEEKFNE